MALLSAYSNDTLMTREQIRQLPVPAALGSRHLPVSFGTYIDEVADQLERNGLIIKEENHIIGHEGQRYFGVMEVAALEGELITASDWSMLVGLRGSHDQSVPRAICLGHHVMVCSNLCFSGSIATISTKQTLNIHSRLPLIIRDAVNQIPELSHREEKRIDRMRNYEIKPRLGDAMLVELMRRGALTTGQIGRAASEWMEPSYPEHAAQGYTAWRLEQAVTEAIKPSGSQSNIFTASHRTELATEFFAQIVG